MPQALSPASIDGNQEAQPTTALPLAHNLQLLQQTVSVQPTVQQPTTALPPINNQQFPQQTTPIQPHPIPVQLLLYRQVQSFNQVQSPVQSFNQV